MEKLRTWLVNFLSYPRGAGGRGGGVDRVGVVRP